MKEFQEGRLSNSVSFRNDRDSGNLHPMCTGNDTNYADSSHSHADADENKEICSYVPGTRQGYVILYIQMGLCEKTLHNWLEERNEPSPQIMITRILSQIICGLDYIHSRNIVHHDIKPSNIFITTSGQLQVQLGDFGLACPLQTGNHHSILGTHLYAAPEQLEGKCDPKSDVYSVGIVLLELLVPTDTHMERCKVIKDARRGRLPTSLAMDYPQLVQILSSLVQFDPKRRPTTSQLLRDINEDKDMVIAQLRDTIIDKDNTIKRLREKIFALENEINKVKHH